METCEPFSVHDEIEKSILLGGGLKLHVGGVVQEDQVVFGQILRGEHIVGVGKVDAECLGLFRHGLYGIVCIRNRAMDEPFASIEQQNASFFFGSRYGLRRDCGLDGRFLSIRQRAEAFGFFLLPWVGILGRNDIGKVTGNATGNEAQRQSE